VPGTSHGQQCCYDEAGLLITGGEAAGTPDLVQVPSGVGAAIVGMFTSGPGPLDVLDHLSMDVEPWEQLGWKVYNQYWVPNNGNNCPANEKP
jgi:hypothetical protein